MRVLGYFLFSLLFLAALSLFFGEMFGEGFKAVYFVVILSSLAVSIIIGLKLRLSLYDIAAVNSFAGFAFFFPLVKSYDGGMATLLAFVMVAFLIASSTYLFLRILGWVKPKITR